jgi:hypothetical protein
VKKNVSKAETGRISELINNGELAGIAQELGDCMLELEKMKEALETPNKSSTRPKNSSDISK